MTDLNLKDAPLRLRCLEENVCTVTMDLEDPAIEKIRKALSRSASDGLMDALVVPLGIGRNVDHLVVRQAALPFTAERPSAFYEDLPYAAVVSEDPSPETYRIPTATQAFEPLVPVFCRLPGRREVKRTLALGYASQIDAETADVLVDFSLRYAEAERLWANDPWVALAESSRLSSPA